MPRLILLVFLTIMMIHGGEALAISESPASTAIISIDPVLPKKGQPFTIHIDGQWRNKCIPDPKSITYTLSEYTKWDHPGQTFVYVDVETTPVPEIRCDARYGMDTLALVLL